MKLFNQKDKDEILISNYEFESNVLERELKFNTDELNELGKSSFYKAFCLKNNIKRLLLFNRWWLILSVVIIFLFVGILYLKAKNNIDEEIFNEYYSIENVIDVSRGNNDFFEAIVSFQQKDYVTASKLFEDILLKDSTNKAIIFYYGIANIETQNYNNAETSFNKIIKNNDNLYIEHAQWYLALCYLKEKKEIKATELFTIISKDSENYYQKKSIEILKKLESENN